MQPGGQEYPPELRRPERARDNEDVKVAPAVAPLVHVNAPHPLDARQSSLDPDEAHTHLCRQLVGECVEVDVLSRVEYDRRQRQRFLGPAYRQRSSFHT